jgi:hypothetical protein
MRRTFFDTLAVLSVLLCLATAALWVHSAVRTAWWQHVGARDGHGFVKQWTFASANGRICWWRLELGPSARPTSGDSGGVQDTSPVEWPWLAGYTEHGLGVAGFYREHMTFSAGPQESRLIAVPYWFVLVGFAFPPMLWWRRRRRAVPGCCRVCGYDLRASAGRCPECGAPSPA